MKPKPFSALNHFTVPCAMCLSSLCGAGAAPHCAEPSRAGPVTHRPEDRESDRPATFTRAGDLVDLRPGGAYAPRAQRRSDPPRRAATGGLGPGDLAGLDAGGADLQLGRRLAR